MSDFESIEFFFASEKSHQITDPLKKQAPTPKQTPRPVQKQPTPPKPVSKLAEKPAPKKPMSPAFKQEEPKKDSFYSEWEEKYKKLQAGNLLAKEPFKRHALFVVEKKDDTPFAKKICEAVNTRLMKATYCPFKGSLETLIDKHAPSHLILSFIPENAPNLPTILLEDLKLTEKDPSKKKALWETLKTSLNET